MARLYLFAEGPTELAFADTVLKPHLPQRRVELLEESFARDIGDRRFLPYIQLHKFEAYKGERRFIEDLTAFHDRDSDFFQGSELYLLRNLSKGRGVGFFEAGNFHRDFILWLLIGNQQRVLFVDPKGIRSLGPTDAKIQFFQTVKEIEQRLGDRNVRLESFIVSNTPSHTMKRLWNMPKTEMQSRHILFQQEDQDTYVRTMLEHAR